MISRKKLLSLLLVGLVVLRLSPGYNHYKIRNSAAAAVVRITNQAGNSGGTGFHVKAPSGKVYILTNAHVCGLAEDGLVYVGYDYERPIPRLVLEASEFTDLCLIEALPSYHGTLSVGSESDPGDKVSAVGHPNLMPTTMTEGEVIGFGEIQVLDHILDSLNDDSCNAPKNKKINLKTIFGPIDVCVVAIKAGFSTTLILPGSSGSPVLNSWGNLTGVIFAGNQEGWSFFVTLADVQKFLSQY